MGTQPVHHITNLQCVGKIFEYGSFPTINNIGHNHPSKIQRLQSKFILLAMRLPEYNSVKLQHASSGLPYVRDRLLSCATRILERISKSPLVEESMTFNRVNRACMGSFSNTAFSSPFCQSLDYYDLLA